MKSNNILKVLGAFSVLTLAACGGGGGGSDAPAPETETAAPTTTTATPTPTPTPTPTTTPTPVPTATIEVDANAVAKSLFDFYQVDANQQSYYNHEVTETTVVPAQSVHADAVKVTQSDGSTETWQPSTSGLLIHGLSIPVLPEITVGSFAIALENVVVTFSDPAAIVTTTDPTPQSFALSGNATITADQLEGEEIVASYSGSSNILGMETVDVPLGTFDALHLNYQLTVSGTYLGFPINQNVVVDTWLVNGIGVIKRTTDVDTLELSNLTNGILAPKFNATSDSQTLEIDGLALQSADYTITLLFDSANANWASVDEGSEVSISVDRSGLAAGNYTAAVKLVAKGSGDVWVLPITLVVAE